MGFSDNSPFLGLFGQGVSMSEGTKILRSGSIGNFPDNAAGFGHGRKS
jgi:hypothetical protein